ncbi:MAG TPA: DUF5715 family protein [Gemmatimonadaceae bacterium]|nr:DUF5715 family protein [Gemmatimonadaceae bacterium]
MLPPFLSRPAPRRALVASVTLALLALAPCAPSVAPAQTLRGTSASVERAHRSARDRGLRFYRTGKSVRHAANDGRLVRLTASRDVRLHDVGYPYVRPATKAFVESLGARYRRACGQPLGVTSAVRPTTEQPLNGSPHSVHPAGIAVDLRKPRGRCLTWLRKELLSLERRRIVDATEEHQPPHFHVVVYARSAEPDPDDRPRVAGIALIPLSTARPTVHVVRRGETLWGIARRYGTTVERLQRANGLRGGRIVAGQRLTLR